MNLAFNLGTVEAIMLAGVRMAAFIIIAPPFSFRAIPARVKAMLAIGLAIAVSPQVVPGYRSGNTIAFLGDLVVQLLVGLSLGFLVMVIFSAIQSAGSLLDMFGGFQMAQGFDPQLNLNGAQLTKLFQMTALALMMSTGAYQLVLGGIAKTFTAIPLGASFDLNAVAENAVSAVSGMFVAAVQIAGPLAIILFLADVGLGLLTRVAPALNAFAIGFPLKILLTLSLGSVLFVVLPSVVESLTGQAVHLLVGL